MEKMRVHETYRLYAGPEFNKLRKLKCKFFLQDIVAIEESMEIPGKTQVTHLTIGNFVIEDDFDEFNELHNEFIEQIVKDERGF